MWGFSQWGSNTDSNSQHQEETRRDGRSLEGTSGGANNAFASAASFFSNLKDTITTMADQHLKELNVEFKRNDALKREQKRQEELRKKVIPPWIALEEEKSILEDDLKQKILEISKNERNFVVSPPEEVFEFDLISALPYIQGAFKHDPNLDKVRYKLVPKRLKELDFFRNYFYRISLIREDMKFEALPISTEVILPEEMTGQQNSIAMEPLEKKPEATQESKEMPTKEQSGDLYEPTPPPSGNEVVEIANDDGEPNKKEAASSAQEKTIQELEEDLGLDDDDDTEFITDDFVNIGIRDARQRDPLEGTGDEDVDLKALESMVEELENSSELP
mmetsp:Transcript_2359/g.3260  ORF Transcript_2359/g.3260 Transcript_2359/m.3260 type:complete len:333 (+) Transcript_2359:104-1102(+)